MERKYNYDILALIKKRWSPRAFSEGKISKDDVMAVLEAARYAPSCFNGQPWRFILAYEETDLEKMRQVLFESNVKWAKRAPVLILIASKKIFEETGKDNRWNMFDAGTSFGYLTLEAQSRGLITHGMGGFSQKKAREIFDISDEYNLMAVVALGKYGDKTLLDEDLLSKEQPNTRKPIEDLLL